MQQNQVRNVNVFFGTAADIQRNEIRVNGALLGAEDLSILARTRIVGAVGFGRKPARGRSPTLYELKARGDIQFTTNVENFEEKFTNLEKVRAEVKQYDAELEARVNERKQAERALVAQAVKEARNARKAAQGTAVMAAIAGTVTADSSGSTEGESTQVTITHGIVSDAVHSQNVGTETTEDSPF